MRPQISTDFFSLALPRAIAHRGAGGTHPENTLPAFAAAYEVGARYFELDVHQTRDGQVVVIHDDDLGRTCDRAGLVAELTYAEVARADAGFAFRSGEGDFPLRGQGLKVPTLTEVLNAFPGVRFIIEVKQVAPSLISALLGVIDSTGMRRRVLIASEHQQPLDEVRAAAPELPTNLSALEVGRFVQALPSAVADYQPPGNALQIPPQYESFKLVTPESVAGAHQAGLEMYVWTVNEEAQMRELLGLGVDGIISDYPVRLLKVLVHDRH